MNRGQSYFSLTGSDAGFSLLSTLSVCSCMAILCTLLTSVAQLIISSTWLRTLHDRSYWLARSEAFQIVKTIQAGQYPVASFQQVIDGEIVSVADSENTNHQWSVHITVTFSGLPIRDTVVFVYDAQTNVFLSWQNNSAS